MNTAKAWRAARRWPVVVVVGAFVLGALVGNGVGHRRSSLSYIDAYAECLLQRVTAGMGNDAVQAVEFGCARRAAREAALAPTSASTQADTTARAPAKPADTAGDPFLEAARATEPTRNR